MKRIQVFAIGILSLALASCTTKQDPRVQNADHKIHLTMQQMQGITDSMPRNLAEGQTYWNLRLNTEREWCSGFWDGCLWYDYALTGKQDVLDAATATALQMEYLTTQPVFDHDLGFLSITSLLNGYRLSPDSVMRQRFRADLLQCADSLATLFNPQVGTLLSWPRNMQMFGGHNTIMDNMINLELLFWAAEETGRTDLRDIAISHADTTMAYHFRQDGSCYHVAVYDPVTGAHRYNCTHQGYADESIWARGQAWAVYGYTMVYRYTHEPRHLAMAERAAEAFISRLPEDHVPYWDFCDPRIPDAPRDASAAAIVASALYELATLLPSEQGDRGGLLREADHIMQSLSTQYLAAEASPAILAHSTGHHPAGSEIDMSIIYADYYYLEALYRSKQNHANNLR